MKDPRLAKQKKKKKLENRWYSICNHMMKKCAKLESCVYVVVWKLW